MMLRAAWKTLRKSWLMNSITMLQLAAALLAASMLVSSVWLRYRKYLPFRDWFQAQGILCQYDSFAYWGDNTTDDGFYALNGGNIDMLSAPVEALGAYEMWLFGEEIDLQKYCLDDEIFTRYTPELTEGRMPDPSHHDGEIEGVISHNVAAVQVGDILPCGMSFMVDGSNEPQTFHCNIRIVGRLADGVDMPALVGGSVSEDRRNTFFEFYSTFNEMNDTGDTLIYPVSQILDLIPEIEKQHKLSLGHGLVMLRYKEPVTQEQIAEDRKTLAQTGAMRTLSLEEIDKNSQSWLWHEMYNMMPIIVMLMILVSVSTISTTALATRRRLRDYAVYALSGLPWGRCIVINLLQSLMTAAGAGLLALAGGIVISHTALKDTFYLHFTLWLLPAAAIILLLYLAVSLLMPWLMLRRSSVREVLKTN